MDALKRQSTSAAAPKAATAPERSPLAESADWRLFREARARQRRAGLFAAVVLVIAFAVLVDGLLSHMRGGGSWRLEMLPGKVEALSGPLGSGQPVEEDVRAFPIPPDAPIEFQFLGFFSSYWFGTGMWRGQVHVLEQAPSGVYKLAVGLEGQPSSTFQTYTISVARDRREQNRLSLSFVRRFTGFNPFWLAALFAALGVGTGLGSFFLGKRLTGLLRSMGLAEIVRVTPEGDLLRVIAVVGKREIVGKSFVAYDENLNRLGKFAYESEKNGLATGLFVPGGHGVPATGSFVAFWEREEPQPRPMRRPGLLSGILGPMLEKRKARAADEGQEDDRNAAPPARSAGHAVSDTKRRQQGDNES